MMFNNIMVYFTSSWHEIASFMAHNPVEAVISAVLGIGAGIALMGILPIFRQKK